GLDHDVVERRNLTRLAAMVETVQRADEVAEHGAAEAAVFEHHDGVIAGRHQRMIEADLAEFVDHHGGLRQRRMAQAAVEQSRLAASEKSRENRNRNLPQSTPSQNTSQPGKPQEIRRSEGKLVMISHPSLVTTTSSSMRAAPEPSSAPFQVSSANTMPSLSGVFCPV